MLGSWTLVISSVARVLVLFLEGLFGCGCEKEEEDDDDDEGMFFFLHSPVFVGSSIHI
jgi:hypothetical protein